MTAALPMGSQKITGMADPTVSTDGATKNYVDTTTATFFSTGDVKLTLKNGADAGWVLCDDGTIGSAGSGSSNRANADTQALFTLLFNNMTDAFAPIFTSGGGATTRAGQTNAATAWAANCRISLTKTLGRTLGIAGNGAGLSGRSLGQNLGLETATLVTANLPPYTPAGSVPITNGTNVVRDPSGLGTATTSTSTPNSLIISLSGFVSTITALFTGTAQGGTSTPVSVMQPTSFLNAMIKL